MTKPISQADDLAAQGRISDAFSLLTTAANGGDADASFKLAEWRLGGDLIRRDLGESRDWFGRAAVQGRDDAWPVYLAFLANGAGGSASTWPEAVAQLRERAANAPPAARQLQLLDRMQLEDQGNPALPIEVRQASQNPRVFAAERFLDEAECRYLIDVATPRMHPAVVVDPASGQFIRDPVRTSLSTSFPLALEDPVIHAINRRIASATGTDVRCGEPVQVLSYSGGQEYKPHSDAIANIDNQRVLTFLVYLNEGYEGGETAFVREELRFKGRTGDAIFFYNVDESGRPDDAAKHAGLPVPRGTKLLLSRWIRERPLDLSGPPGRPF